MIYPTDMDPECIPLCDALNALPGIRTLESCCGHGREPHRVWFAAASVDNLRPVLVAARKSQGPWTVRAGWANGSDTIYFCMEGPPGSPDAPGNATEFATLLRNP